MSVYGFSPRYVSETFIGERGPWWARRDWYSSDKAQTYVSERFKRSFTIPAGFEYERFSIPPVLRWFVRRSVPKINPAAKLHDMLCAAKGYYDGQHYSRKQVDALFKEAMVALDGGVISRNVRHWGVRLYDTFFKTW